MYKLFFKRFFDLVCSIIILLLISPILLAVAVFIALTSPGPIFFRQERLGKNGRLFYICKFRTMTHRPDRIPGEAGELYANSGNSEMIRGGNFLRRFKLDELPQFINIVKGEMSFIGPRPCLPDAIREFDEFGRKRLTVTPGCTGLAQINGNIYISWSERWKFDAYYAENLSFLLDVEIALKTIEIVIRGEDKAAKTFEEWKNERKSR